MHPKRSLSRPNLGVYNVNSELPSYIEPESHRSMTKSNSFYPSPMNRNQLFPSFVSNSINRRKIYRSSLQPNLKISTKQNYEDPTEPVRGYNVFQFPISPEPSYRSPNSHRESDAPFSNHGILGIKVVSINDQSTMSKVSPRLGDSNITFSEKMAEKYSHFRKTHDHIRPPGNFNNNMLELKRRVSNAKVYFDVGPNEGEIDPALAQSKGFKGKPKKVTLLEKKTRDFLQAKKNSVQKELEEASKALLEKEIFKDLMETKHDKLDEDSASPVTERHPPSPLLSSNAVNVHWTPGKECSSLNSSLERERSKPVKTWEVKKIPEPGQLSRSQLSQGKSLILKDTSRPSSREKIFSISTARDHVSSTPRAREQDRIGHVKPRIFQSIEFARLNKEFKREMGRMETRSRTFIHKLELQKRQESPLVVVESPHRQKRENSRGNIKLVLKSPPAKNKRSNSPGKKFAGGQEKSKDVRKSDFKKGALGEELGDFKLEGWESEEGDKVANSKEIY